MLASWRWARQALSSTLERQQAKALSGDIYCAANFPDSTNIGR